MDWLQVETELHAAGLSSDAISGIMGAMQMRSLEDVQQLLGQDNEAVRQLQRLFQLAEGYGFRDWLVYDASIVRGLAYYTGTAHMMSISMIDTLVCLHGTCYCHRSAHSTCCFASQRPYCQMFAYCWV